MSAASKKPPQWIPASTKPECCEVFVIGGRYAPCRALYIRHFSNLEKQIKEGFYLPLGGGLLDRLEWVEFWFPYPEMPKVEVKS